MKSIAKTMLAAGTALMMAATPLFAGTLVETSKNVVPAEAEPEPWWSASLKASYDSIYMFRGVNLGENLVSTDLSFSAYGFTLGAWYAGLADEDYTELDLYASYTYAVGPISLTGGYIYYNFFRSDDETHELFAGLSLTSLPYVTPSLTFYYDIDLFDGGYLEFKLASSIPVVEDVFSIDPYALISWDFEYNSNGNDWNHFQAGVAFPIKLNENITFSPYGAVSVPMEAIEDCQDTEWFGGASITFTF